MSQDAYNVLYKRWRDLPWAELYGLAESAIRTLDMDEVIALRMIFIERHEKALQESHQNVV